MIKCNICGILQPDWQFYKSHTYYKGTKYEHFYKVCRKCISKRAKEKTLAKQEQQKQELKIKEEKDTIEKKEWIKRNLERYGNCYIRKTTNIDPEILEHCDIQPVGDMLGFIIKEKRR